MPVSPLLNDLALAAATDRTLASRKTAPKASDADFSSALQETRREAADANPVPKRSIQARPQAKHVPRDHRNAEIPKANSSRHDQHELKANAHHDEARHQARHDAQADQNHETHEHGKAKGHSKAVEGGKPQDQTAGAVEDSDQAVINDTSTTETAVAAEAETSETLGASTLDASALVQTNIAVAPQVIQSAVIPVDAQVAAVLAGPIVADVKPSTAVSDDETGVETVANPTEAKSEQSNAPIASAGVTAAQVFVAAKASKTEPLQSAELASKTASVSSLGQASVKSAGAEKSDTADTKASVTTIESGNVQSNQASVERQFTVAEQPALKQAFTEALAATANKTNDNVTGISAASATVSTEAAQGIKSPVASPAEAMARADAPVPLQSVAVEIGMRAMRGSKEFSIRLDPEDLGRIDIKLEISEAGEVQAKLTVDRVETLQLLQRDAKTLERAFDQAGLKSNPDGLQFSLRDQGQQRDSQTGQQSERPKFNGSEKELSIMEDGARIRSFRYPSPATSGLDIRI